MDVHGNRPVRGKLYGKGNIFIIGVACVHFGQEFLRIRSFLLVLGGKSDGYNPRVAGNGLRRADLLLQPSHERLICFLGNHLGELVIVFQGFRFAQGVRDKPEGKKKQQDGRDQQQKILRGNLARIVFPDQWVQHPHLHFIPGLFSAAKRII